MDKETFKDILTMTYERTTQDNFEDKMELVTKIITLCGYLIGKNILTREEMEDILNAGLKNEKSEDSK